MIFHYVSGGTLMCEIPIPGVTDDMGRHLSITNSGDDLEYVDMTRYYDGYRYFVCESMSLAAARWIVKGVGGYLVENFRVPATHQLGPAPPVGKYGHFELGKWEQCRDVEIEGWANWIDNGVWFIGPEVDPELFGGHEYDDGGYELGIRDCRCGCSMHDSSSWGPCDPFGACPENPLATEYHQ